MPKRILVLNMRSNPVTNYEVGTPYQRTTPALSPEIEVIDITHPAHSDSAWETAQQLVVSAVSAYDKTEPWGIALILPTDAYAASLVALALTDELSVVPYYLLVPNPNDQSQQPYIWIDCTGPTRSQIEQRRLMGAAVDQARTAAAGGRIQVPLADLANAILNHDGSADNGYIWINGTTAQFEGYNWTP